MIGSLFRKRDSFYNNSPSPTSPSSPNLQNTSSLLSPSPSFPFTASSLDNDTSPNIHNNRNSSSSGHNSRGINNNNGKSDFINPLNLNLNSNSGSNHNHSNGLHKMATQEIDNLSNESNLHMPSLYGLNPNSSSPLPSTKLSDKLNGFRMVIIQDAGIRKKQPLFDSAVSYNMNFKMVPQKLNKKLYHSINELSLYMFGCYGMPISENNMTTKLHYLPSLTGMHSSVLITRLFSIDSSFQLKPHKISEHSSDWEPHPILSTDELPLCENFSVRFSIGIILPVSLSIESARDEITQNWLQISECLLSLQNVIVSKLRANHLSNINNSKYKKSISQSSNSSITNFSEDQNNQAKLNFNIYCLQSEYELYQELASFLKRIISLLEIPRLFIDLKHSNQSLINWASTLSLWLELKDGRVYCQSDQDVHSPPPSTGEFINPIASTDSSQSLKYLASLISIFLPLRNEMFGSNNYESIKSKVRIVVGTSNPIVSQKLIFILAGILGYEKFSEIYDSLQNSDVFTSHKSLIVSNSAPIPQVKHESNFVLQNVQTRNNALFVDIPPNNLEHNSIKSSPLTISHSPSVSTISANIKSQRIPIPSLQRTSSYASLQNLSSSYSKSIQNSIGSQTSSSSWRNNFGSFMDRWKNSITSSPTTQFSQPLFHSSTTQTPSPNMEYDEFPWFPHRRSTNMLSSSPASFTSTHTSNTQNTNKYSLTNNSIINTYKAHDNYKINRSTNNLLGTKFHNIVDSIDSEISSIINGDFDSNVIDSDPSVLDVTMKSNNFSEMNASTEIQLPMLAGYISQFRPEFNMLSCPVNTLVDELFIESLKNDLKFLNVNQSDIYFVNLGMRCVNVCQMKSHDKNRLHDSNKLYVTPTNGTDFANNDLPLHDSKSNSKKSNLTKSLESGLEYHSKRIFSPSKPSTSNAPLKILSSLCQENVNVIDEILGKIAFIINEFFHEINTNSYDTDFMIAKEEKCCNSIRVLILELITTVDSHGTPNLC